MKQYGDEDFIFLIKEEEEAIAEKKAMAEGTESVPKNDIRNGYIILHEEKILFEELPVSEEEFSMILPEMFEPLSEELAEIKYPSVNRPDFILTNPATTINLTFSHKADKMRNEQTEEAKNAIQKVIMKVHPASKVIESKVIQVQDRNIAYFDFITPAIDSDIYNLMFFFSLKETMLMGSFNCLEPDRHDWKEIAVQMLESIRFL